jgi:hypothetical protein
VNIRRVTEQYETWLGERLTIVTPDLKQKHLNMASDLFIFLRATFYRWAQIYPKVCSHLASAPAVLAVGDLHIENFGTWRDREGRLIWGVNDLDEAYPLPYTNDLVRLATSVNLAISTNRLALTLPDGCRAILAGYSQGLAAGGRPFVLAEDHTDLRTMAIARLRDPGRFWKGLDAQTPVKGPIPASATEALEYLMPEPGLSYRVVQRQAGEGSLGRQRFVALTDWHGGRIAREVKALAPSACVWAQAQEGPKDILYQALLSRAVRCRDPFVELRGQWIVRRLAPDCSRIELSSLPESRDENCLLEAMGWETANIHLGTSEARKALESDLKKHPADWLPAAAEAMTEAMRKDWEAWRAKTRAESARGSVAESARGSVAGKGKDHHNTRSSPGAKRRAHRS